MSMMVLADAAVPVQATSAAALRVVQSLILFPPGLSSNIQAHVIALAEGFADRTTCSRHCDFE